MNQERVVSLASTIDVDFGRRIDFLLEIDKLKTVLRRSRLVDGSRYENTAEHSWHLAMLVMILAPHAHPEVDAALDEVIEAGRAHGVAVGIPIADMSRVDEYRRRGVSFFATSDRGIVANAMAAFRASF